MNIIIDDYDYLLIIKVVFIFIVCIQVYFIDNDEFFKCKNNVIEDSGEDYKDNDECSMFFVCGVLEIVKKLGWKLDVIYCYGWMIFLMLLYIKKIYNKDLYFVDMKVVYFIYGENEGFI